jgi:hypothetical protein
MARWWLFNGWGDARQKLLAWVPFSMRVHYIATADEDRELHDHPWPARTFILKGWYREIRLVDPTRLEVTRDIGDHPPGTYFRGGDQVEFLRQAGDTATLDFEEFHRITEISEGGVYTLFVSWGWAGDWGFLSPTGLKVWWREWLGIPKTDEPAAPNPRDTRPDADSPALLQAERALAEWRKTEAAVQMRRALRKNGLVIPDWAVDDEISLAQPRITSILAGEHPAPEPFDPREVNEAVALRDLANLGFTKEEFLNACSKFLAISNPRIHTRRMRAARAALKAMGYARMSDIPDGPLQADMLRRLSNWIPSSTAVSEQDLRDESEEGHY